MTGRERRRIRRATKLKVETVCKPLIDKAGSTTAP
jgi:hypothetical protein